MLNVNIFKYSRFILQRKVLKNALSWEKKQLTIIAKHDIITQCKQDGLSVFAAELFVNLFTQLLRSLSVKTDNEHRKGEGR